MKQRKGRKSALGLILLVSVKNILHINKVNSDDIQKLDVKACKSQIPKHSRNSTRKTNKKKAKKKCKLLKNVISSFKNKITFPRMIILRFQAESLGFFLA